MPDTYESRVAQGELPEQARDEVCLNTLQQELGVSYHSLVWSWKRDGFEPPTIAEWNKVCRALRAAQAAQVDKDRLEQRVKELEKGTQELLTFLDNIRCGLAMSHSNATCVYYKELGEYFTKLTALPAGKDGV